jgi:PAS domain S-box-containing protein
MAAGNGVLLVVATLLLTAVSFIYHTSNQVKEKEVKQTAIAQALDDSGTAMIVLDDKANVLYWDENAVKMFGFTSSEIINKSIDTVVPHGKEHKELVGDYISDQNAGVKIVMCEGKQKDGSIIPLSLRVQPKFKEKQVLVFADLITDNTYTER